MEPHKLSPLDERQRALFDRHRQQIYRRTDRFFVLLMLLQWMGAVSASLLIAPRTWSGTTSNTHPHVWEALVFGGVLCSLPIFLAVRMPGRGITRYTIAVAQLLFSSLL